MSSSAPWQAIAVASGTFAALNAIFAKLTTNTLTTSLASYVATTLDLSSTSSNILEITLRAAVFGLSFLFTGTMWTLYTKALSSGPSAVQVNVINTASNFVITALLGAIVFGEALPLLWWIGAAFLVAGTVIIGSGKEDEKNATAEQEKKDL